MNRVIAVVFVAWSSAALAQSAGAQAEMLFRQGRDLMSAGKLTEACSAFGESQKLEPAVTTLLNLAGCREMLGQIATAWELFLDATHQTGSATDAATQQLHDIAQAHARKLEPRVSRLTINVPQKSQLDGLEITRGIDRVGAGLWNRALPIDGGSYMITARAPRAKRWSTQVTIAAENDTKMVEIPDLLNLPRDLDKPAAPPPQEVVAAAAIAHSPMPPHGSREVVLTSTAAQPALAPKKQPTNHQLGQARAHFKAAEAAKAHGDYKTAVGEYLAAYELVEESELFFDVGEVYRLAGDEHNALTYYQKYLELEPNGHGAVAARAAAEDLQRSIAAKEDAAEIAADKTKRKATEQAKRKVTEDAVRHTAEIAVHKNPRRASASGGRRLRITGLATGGVGVVALSVGVAFGLRAKSISDEAVGWDRFDPARFDQGEAAERNMFILTGIGAAALVTGSVLYYLGRRADTIDDSGVCSTVTFAPAIVPGEVAFAAMGRF